MIGNAYPYLDSGYSILEQGDIDPIRLSLKISAYLAVDRQARVLAEFVSKADAESFLAEYLSQQKESAQQ